jgi:hypothetical protein
MTINENHSENTITELNSQGSQGFVDLTSEPPKDLFTVEPSSNSNNSNESSVETKKKRGKPKKIETEAKQATDKLISDEILVSSLSAIASFSFSQVAKFTNDNKWIITDNEALSLGKAIVPVLNKYGIDFGTYKEEIGLILVCSGIIIPRIVANNDNRNEGTRQDNVIKTVS